MKKYFLNLFLYILFNIVILSVSYSQTYNISIWFTLIYYLLIFLLVYFFGCLKNDSDIYKRNIIMYLFLYISFLLSFTLLLGRTGMGLIDKEYFDSYVKTINLIPFKTIIEYLLSINNFKLFSYNIIGNIIALTPLSIILILINEKNTNLKKQFLILSLVTFIIEFLQLILCAGRFDIDDYILNVGGALLFVTILNKFNLVSNISYLFNTDFRINYKIKRVIYILILSITTLISVILICELIDNNKLKTNPIEEKLFFLNDEKCSQLETVVLNNLVLNFDCINVYYEDDKGVQMTLKEAFENQVLTTDSLKKILLKENFMFDNEHNLYFDDDDKIYIYICDNSISFLQKYKTENACFN